MPDRFVFSMVHIVTNDLLERLHSGPPVPSFTRNLVLQTGSTMINAQMSMWIVVAGKMTPWGKAPKKGHGAYNSTICDCCPVN